VQQCRPAHAEAYVYRSTHGRAWELAMDGLPSPCGTTASRFAVDPGRRVVYAANNRGLYRSGDAGGTWTSLDVAWPSGALSRGVDAVAVLPA